MGSRIKKHKRGVAMLDNKYTHARQLHVALFGSGLSISVVYITQRFIFVRFSVGWQPLKRVAEEPIPNFQLALKDQTSMKQQSKITRDKQFLQMNCIFLTSTFK